ncbi:MAG: DUF2249 domain-containing protein [Xanthomonadales bacterium]|nr:DUF2249 domain-containing protein [Xanthomonadales bacterium]
MHLGLVESSDGMVDLRDLPPPLPLRCALALAEDLRSGESITVLTPLWPQQLLDALVMAGMAWSAVHLPEGGARVEFRRSDGCD